MKIAIVGAGNVGTELAVRLRGEHEVLLVDRENPAHLAAALAEGKNVRFVRADALNEAEMGRVLNGFDPDVLVGTVGTFSAASAFEAPDEFKKEFETNFLGNLIPIKAVLPRMIEKKSGQIIILSSTSGHLSPANLTSYAPSKWALESLCGSLRSEVEELGIRVAWLAPKTLRNKYSEAFRFESGLAPERVARTIERMIARRRQGPTSPT